MRRWKRFPKIVDNANFSIIYSAFIFGASCLFLHIRNILLFIQCMHFDGSAVFYTIRLERVWNTLFRLRQSVRLSPCTMRYAVINVIDINRFRLTQTLAIVQFNLTFHAKLFNQLKNEHEPNWKTCQSQLYCQRIRIAIARYQVELEKYFGWSLFSRVDEWIFDPQRACITCVKNIFFLHIKHKYGMSWHKLNRTVNGK